MNLRISSASLTATVALLLGACSPLSPSGDGAAPAARSPVIDVPSVVPADILARLKAIGPVVAPPATAPLYTPLQQREPYAGARIARNERYGDDARHRLDVFTGLDKSLGKPVLVFVHGGAFIAGDKRTGDSPFYDNIALWAVRNGFVGVNMTYRLAPAHPWPAAQQDLNAALQWVRQNILRFGGDPGRIVLMGHSAGAAHVAQYLGHAGFHVAPGSGLAGAVMISGLFDTTTADASPALQAYFGKDRSLYAQRSALPGMLQSRVPMFIAWAELDPPDFHRQAEQAVAGLCAQGRCPKAYRLLGHSHMSEVYAIHSEDESLTGNLRDFIRALR